MEYFHSLTNTIWVADLLRFINLVLCLLTIVLSCLCFFFYRKRTQLETRHYMVYNEKLARHIYQASAATTLGACGVAVDLYYRLGETMSWRGPFVLLTFALLALAQRNLLSSLIAALEERKQQVRDAAHAVDISEGT